MKGRKRKRKGEGGKEGERERERILNCNEENSGIYSLGRRKMEGNYAKVK